MNVRSALAFLVLSLACGAAYAAPTAAIPEPGMTELLAISAVAGIAVAIRNRRKK